MSGVEFVIVAQSPASIADPAPKQLLTAVAPEQSTASTMSTSKLAGPLQLKAQISSDKSSEPATKPTQVI